MTRSDDAVGPVAEGPWVSEAERHLVAQSALTIDRLLRAMLMLADGKRASVPAHEFMMEPEPDPRSPPRTRRR